MHPILILLIGMAIVIGGVLLLRMHAFLALLSAALVVGALTPHQTRTDYLVTSRAEDVLEIADDGRTVVLEVTADAAIQPGMQYLVLRPEPAAGTDLAKFATLTIVELGTRSVDGKDVRVATARAEESDAVLNESDIIIHPLSLQAARDEADEPLGERVAEAFGSTCATIGILIAMAAIIGKCLLDSGAADKIVRSALKVCGERGAPAAFVGSGFLLGIPVFFDTVFYLMIPLGKALNMRTGRNYLLYVLTIVAGATMAHSLVPPTPGPLFVAEQLDVDMGLMILVGCLIGLVSSSVGYLFALWSNRRWSVPLRESPDFLLKDLEELVSREESQLPPLLIALAPILLPVLLIAGSTVIESSSWQLSDSVDQAVEIVGNKNIALILAAAVAMGLLIWKKRTDLRDLAVAVQAALASGGVIILITAAGGAFGAALQQTGVAGLVQQIPQGSPALVITLAFLVTTAVRTAQGSATVAMITAAGVLSPLVDGLSFHPVYLAMAIGCGSKPIAWMNDSGFWVICKMSGMTEAEGLRSVTPMSILMGLAGLIATLVAATVWPLT